MEARDFWDDFFSRGMDPGSRVGTVDPADPALNAAAAHFGDLSGRTVLDLGSGRGASSLFFASRGARVISVDYSAAAVENLRAYCEENDLRSIEPVVCSAMDVARLGPVDFVYGSMILHHIEPFDRFAAVLRDTLAPQGRAFFYENNSRSGLMIWFRQNVVGRFGVPKYGDEEEFPLTPGEVDQMRRYFRVDVEFPELFLFRMVSIYLLRGRLPGPFEALDRFGYRLRPLRKFSYRQYVKLSPPT